MMYDNDGGSREVAQAVLRMVATSDREEERLLKAEYESKQISLAVVDYGGEFIPSISRMIERAIVIAKREHVIGDSHSEEGSVGGAAREAISQVMPKAMGLNVGGKIAVARYADHVAVAVFFRIGMLNLNEVAVGMGHRAI